MKKQILASILCAITLLTASNAYADKPFVEEETIPFVLAPQAPPSHELEIATPKPGPDFSWIKGHWHWNNQWTWMKGHWSKLPHPGATWMNGYWVQKPHGWIWVHGHWE